MKPSQPQTVIRAKGLGKIYRGGATELRALQEVDLEVRAGELTMLMGPSGQRENDVAFHSGVHSAGERREAGGARA